MECKEKLFKFLLLDDNVLQDEEFIEYNVKKIYRKLWEKYKASLSVLEYLKAYAQTALVDLEKEGCVNVEDIQYKIKEIIEKNQVDKIHIILYVKAKVTDATQTDIQLSSALMNSITRVQREAIERIYSYYIEIYKNENCINLASFYERLIRNVEQLEKIFFKTYAFHDLFDEKEWCGYDSKTFVQTLEQLAVILLRDESNIEENLSIDELEDTSERIYSKDNIAYDPYGLENDVDRDILFGFAVVEGLLKIYDVYNLQSAKREKNKYRKNIQIGYEDKEAIDEMISFLEEKTKDFQQDNGDSREETIKKKKDARLIEDVFVNLLRTYKISRELELDYMSNFIAADIDFMRYQKMVAKLEDLIKVYYDNKEVRYTKLETKSEKEKDKQRREINEKRRNKAFEDMVKLYKAIAVGKRTAMSKVTARLNKKVSQDSKAHNELIEVDLYRAIFSDMRKETNRVGDMIRKAENIGSNNAGKIRENTNRFYTYKNIAIMTLTFPNSEIQKYKKAAILFDKRDISKLYLNSGKRCWTFKNGLECTHGTYKSKTMKPDKITTNAGKLVLLDALMGVRTKKVSLLEQETKDEKKKVYYTKSHKFDLRVGNITEEVGNSKSLNESNYYSGKIRIEDEGELKDCNTVCVNNECNDKEAAILYFDNADKLKKFIDAL